MSTFYVGKRLRGSEEAKGKKTTEEGSPVKRIVRGGGIKALGREPNPHEEPLPPWQSRIRERDCSSKGGMRLRTTVSSKFFVPLRRFTS